jgi:hypothetical protein
MADEDGEARSAPEARPLRGAIELRRPMRWAALALGLAGLGSGGASVFITHLEAGPVALLAVGLILALVGLSGVLPTRLKVGDNEAEWMQERAAVAGILKDQAASAPAEDREKVEDLVDRVAAVAPEVAGPAISVFDGERSILNLLREVVVTDDIQFSVIRAGKSGRRYEWDGIIDLAPDSDTRRSRARRILIEIKWDVRSYAIFRETIGKAIAYARDFPQYEVALLLIVAQAPSRSWGTMVSESPPGVYLSSTEKTELRVRLDQAASDPPIQVPDKSSEDRV